MMAMESYEERVQEEHVGMWVCVVIRLGNTAIEII